LHNVDEEKVEENRLSQELGGILSSNLPSIDVDQELLYQFPLEEITHEAGETAMSPQGTTFDNRATTFDNQIPPDYND
jgi:hypothetical protein